MSILCKNKKEKTLNPFCFQQEPFQFEMNLTNLLFIFLRDICKMHSRTSTCYYCRAEKMKVVQFAQFPVLINELDDPAGDPGPRVSGLLALLGLVSLPPAEVVLPGVDHDGAAFHVPGPAVPEADHGVVDVDEGDGEVGVGQDVAQVTGVSHGGVGTRVIILK